MVRSVPPRSTAGASICMAVETDDGRRGTAIYEVTGRHHHRFFPEPLATGTP